MDVVGQLADAATALAGSPWLLAAVLGLAMVDGLVPPVPSETVLVTAAVLAVDGDGVHVVALVLAAALGAFLGDTTAYLLGRLVPVGRIPGLRGARGAAAVEAAGRTLRRRGVPMVVAGRFVPVGRVAINVGAGALGLPPRRFLPAAATAAALWASVTATLGVWAHALVGGHPLVSVAIGVAAGMLIGLGLDAVLQRLGSGRTAAREGPGLGPATECEGSEDRGITRAATDAVGPPGDAPRASRAARHTDEPPERD